MARKIVPANHHWKRIRETQDTSVQSILKVVHKRTYVRVLFSLGTTTKKWIILSIGVGLHSFFVASATEGHKKFEKIAFVRDFEHSGNEIDFSGLKGWEDFEVDNVKPQEIVSSLPLGHGVILLVSCLQRRCLPRASGPRCEIFGIAPSCTRCGAHRPYSGYIEVNVEGTFKGEHHRCWAVRSS